MVCAVKRIEYIERKKKENREEEKKNVMHAIYCNFHKVCFCVANYEWSIAHSNMVSIVVVSFIGFIAMLHLYMRRRRIYKTKEKKTTTKNKANTKWEKTTQMATKHKPAAAATTTSKLTCRASSSSILGLARSLH